MAWNTPKTDWQAADVPSTLDFNRIEENTRVLRERIDGHVTREDDVHGIPAGEQIETKSGAQEKIDTMEQEIKDYVDELGEEIERGITIEEARTAAGVELVVEVRSSDPASPRTGQIWVREDLIGGGE